MLRLRAILAMSAIAAVLSAVVLVGACTTSDPSYFTDDKADLSTLDLAIPTGADLATEAKDLATPDLAMQYSCRGQDAPGKSYKLVMNQLTLPSSSGTGSFAYDFDGDGRTENQLKSLISTIAIAGLDMQKPLQDAVQSGQIINLLAIQSAATDTASCVGVTLNRGKLGPMPKFDGSDVFSPVTLFGSPLGGSLLSGKLATTDSRILKADTESSFALPISLGRGLLTLPLRGVHVEGRLQLVGSLWQVSAGVIHGVVAKSDIDSKVLPAVADQVTQLINSDPFSSSARALINLFESSTDPVSVNKCVIAARCCRLNPATCMILPDEVRNSSVGAVLSPDVEVLDEMGKWKPVPGGKKYNAMSVGIGFSAITASF